jgi:hypothetical protein
VGKTTFELEKEKKAVTNKEIKAWETPAQEITDEKLHATGNWHFISIYLI